VVGTEDELGSHELKLEEVNWLADPLEPGDECAVQIRYRARAVPAAVTATGPGTLALRSQEPLRAVTPGQSGVLYSAPGQVLAGGVIA
jgi:tRNA-specific 2-thiouridylase